MQTIDRIATFGGKINPGTVVIVTAEYTDKVDIQVPGGLKVNGLCRNRIRIADEEGLF